MTTTTNFQGMEPGTKSSSRVLCPPGGASNISFGSDDDKPPVRRNKMASHIFDEPDDPHAHRRNNPPGGKPSGILCGEPSAPLRRCHAPPLIPCQNQNNNSTSEPSAEAEEHEQADEVEPSEAEQLGEADVVPETPAPSVPTPAPSNRRIPPGGKSSLVLG